MGYKNVEDRRAYNKSYYEKWNSENPDKLKSYSKKYNSTDKARERDRKYESKRKAEGTNVNRKLLARYGITKKEYDQILLEQDYKCACCKKEETFLHNISGEPRSLCVDHCHKTGKIRGLLCTACNLLIGNSKDRIDILKNAVEYLQSFENQ